MLSLAEEIADLRRAQHRLIRPGVVTEIDLDRALVRVRYAEAPDEAVSGWLPWLATRAGGDRTWWAPEVGEGVVMLAPGGEMASAVVIGALYQESPHDAPSSSADEHVVEYATGAKVVHDRAAKTFTVTTAGGHVVEIDDDANVSVDGDVLADGDVRDGSATTSTMAAMRAAFNAHTHVLGAPVVPAQRM